jgi:hypothetical protein
LEEQDDVKHMNQMQLYAKCVTIRDAQIEEKKHMMLEEEEENRRLDLMMEIERLKALEHYEERERLRAAERVVGQRMLEDQIRARETEKLKAEELQAQERAQVNAEIKRMEAEEAQARERKKQQARLLLEEVAESNAEQVRVPPSAFLSVCLTRHRVDHTSPLFSLCYTAANPSSAKHCNY